MTYYDYNLDEYTAIFCDSNNYILNTYSNINCANEAANALTKHGEALALINNEYNKLCDLYYNNGFACSSEVEQFKKEKLDCVYLLQERIFNFVRTGEKIENEAYIKQCLIPKA